MTIYPTFNWKSFALRLARDIREGDTDGMEDGAKDALLYEDIPCPSIIIGGPNGGRSTCCTECSCDGPVMEDHGKGWFCKSCFLPIEASRIKEAARDD